MMSAEFVGPVSEEGSQCVDMLRGDRQVVVGEAINGAHHLGKDAAVETEVDLGGTGEQHGSSETLSENEDIGKVTGLGAAEERGELAPGEFLRFERRANNAHNRRVGRGCVDGDVHDHLAVAPDVKP